MKLKEFTYKDRNGKITNRTVLVVQEPSEKMSAIDVSDQTDETIVNFALAYETARKTFLAQVQTLEKEFDLKHRFRQFFPDEMNNVVAEEL